jgi:hypothetical protein
MSQVNTKLQIQDLPDEGVVVLHYKYLNEGIARWKTKGEL